MRRRRNAKIIATLGPASSDADTIHALFQAGVDVFRLNFSHGSHDDHRQRIKIIRDLESRAGRPIGILLDLQGPKFRIGNFANGPVQLQVGAPFRLDLNDQPGDQTRVMLPHPEILQALQPDAELLLNDGKLRLKVKRCAPDFADTEVTLGGELSNHKGVNVPGVVIPLSPITPKDRLDLAFGLEIGVDWVAMSFVQRPENLDELRGLVGDRAKLLSKLEKPAALECLEDIVERSDAVMVARGDLGVELPLEQVPSIQKRIVRACRQAGKPVVVATQMLESMIQAPSPTRAETSDVASAIYDGVDAVMLSAETAAGRYPVEAVAMMDRIIIQVEKDPFYRPMIDASRPEPDKTNADAICSALRTIAHILPIASTVTYTSSGSTSLRAARERPEAPILSLTAHVKTARMLALAWGVHSVITKELERVSDVVNDAIQVALTDGYAKRGDALVIAAGMPFGVSGTTNFIRIAWIE
ncbi:MAG: pyruvate kinase [Gammaproteobacteria bacterium]